MKTPEARCLRGPNRSTVGYQIFWRIPFGGGLISPLNGFLGTVHIIAYFKYNYIYLNIFVKYFYGNS
jgi:hypothetical protein